MIESSQATVFHRGRRRSGFRALRSARPPRRRANFDGVALVRLHQRSGDRRYPAHLATTEIGLVNADDDCQARGGASTARANTMAALEPLVSQFEGYARSVVPLRFAPRRR